ncbi:hypothetical protein MmarC5_1178 [Methanococcus maripaludis C5]|uniref:Uncharacterized protein n=2 Tax=Methanococcus maripaludis TaxID=39152 RepID=A4FZ42_METM5|nr:DUF2540 domain-containing protein [Methanococcus maripaludis]ABO35476.1 hypothetical protein MmarC5_1178 [Methanococcus maripaludis C5]MBA2860990.1 hypothetical protein [Methanococcus maripaludis]
MKKNYLFSIYLAITPLELRFFLHELAHLDSIDLDILSEVAHLEKNTKIRLTLTEEDKKIVEKYGKLTNSLLNYVILDHTDKVRV